MSRCVAECTEDASLSEVYQLVQQCEHGLVVVIDSEAHRVPLGVVSERRICEQLILNGKNPRGLTAGSVLDSRIRTVREDAGLEAISPAERTSLAAVIVTNGQRQVVGIVPREKLRETPAAFAATCSNGQVYMNTHVRLSPAKREIPAFGWIQ